MERKDECICCLYCGLFFNDVTHPLHCCDQMGELISCYSCNQSYDASSCSGLFSKNQLQKEHLARCNKCVQEKNTTKYAKYEYLYHDKNYMSFLDKLHINKQLVHYVSMNNVEKVKELLAFGANPNYNRQKQLDHHVYLYDPKGVEIEERNDSQPTNSLRLCIFQLNTCYYTAQEFEKNQTIAEWLCKYGANKQDGLAYFHTLFTTIYPEEGEMMKMYHLLTNESTPYLS